jgi:hypothetical protein
MLTAGDIEFEPNVKKIRYFTSSCAAMIAGDANLQSEIVQAVHLALKERIEAAKEWIPISDIARTYKREVDNAVRRIVEDRILAPFALTMEDFVKNQKDFSADFVRDVQTEVLNFEAPAVEAIIAGIDATGAHIYTASTNSIQCHDAVGFAAIGGGYWHANSQMMAFNYTPENSLPDALMMVMFAKKRAEIAPGVGDATDMFSILGLGRAQRIGDHVTTVLEKQYAEEKRRQQSLANRSRQKINAFVEGLVNQSATTATEQAPIPATPDGDSPDAIEATST